MKGRDGKIFAATLVAAGILVVAGIACKKTAESGKAGKAGGDEAAKASASGAGAAAAEAGNGLDDSPADLSRADFTVFYEELEPFGTWIEATPADLGLAPAIRAEAAVPPMPLLDRILGVKDAFAEVQASATAGAVFVWQPDEDLAAGADADATATSSATVAATIEGVPPEPPAPAEYTPYENGQWVSTDAGWYFHAATPAEEITSHYGRWTFSATLGWVWVPGTVWAPAWVEWREDEEHVAWAPLPPVLAQTGPVIEARPVMDLDKYVVVEKKFFLEPAVYKFKYDVKANPKKLKIKSMTKVNGVMFKEKVVINQGPDVVVIGKVTGKGIEPVKIHKVGKKHDVAYGPAGFFVFAPPIVVVEVGPGLPLPPIPGPGFLPPPPLFAPKVVVKFEEAKVHHGKGGTKPDGPQGKPAPASVHGGKIHGGGWGAGPGPAKPAIKAGSPAKAGGKPGMVKASGKGGGAAKPAVKGGAAKPAGGKGGKGK